MRQYLYTHKTTEKNHMDQELEDQIKKVIKAGNTTTKTLLKNASTEKQRTEIVKNQTKHLKDLSKQITGVGSKQAKYREALKDLTDDTQSLGKDFETTGKSASKLGQTLDELGVATKANIKGTIKGLIETTLAFTRADKKIDNFAEATAGVKTEVFGLKLEDLGRFIDFNAETFKTLAQQGATFGGSVIRLREAATDARMPILDFVDLVAGNSQTFARLFGTVDSAIPTITRFQRELRDRTINELSQFGLNLKETAEFGATVLEIQRLQGNADRIRTMDLAGITVEYTKNLVKLSKLTGESVQEINDQNKAVAANAAFQISMSKLDPKEKARRQGFVAGLRAIDERLEGLTVNLLEVGAPIGDFQKNFIAMNPAVQGIVQQFKMGAITQEEAMNQIFEATSQKGLQGFARASLVTGSFGDALEVTQALERKRAEGLTAEMNARDKNTAGIVAAQDQLEELESAAETAGTAVARDILPTVATGINEVLGKLNQVLDPDQQNIFGKAYDATKEAIKVIVLNFADMYKAAKNVAKKTGEKIKEGGSAVVDAIGTGVNKSAEFLKENTPIEQYIQKLEKFLFPVEGKGLRGFDGSEGYPGAMFGYSENFQTGTNGFRNFGSGTKAVLHGMESVVPKNDIDQAMLTLQSMLPDTGMPNKQTDAPPIVNNAVSPDMNKMISTLENLININQNVENALNSLVSVNVATERNTKMLNNNVANMSGSII